VFGTYIPAVLVAAKLVQLLKKLQGQDSVSIGKVFGTYIPAVLVAAKLVQLLKKLQGPDSVSIGKVFGTYEVKSR